MGHVEVHTMPFAFAFAFAIASCKDGACCLDCAGAAVPGVACAMRTAAAAGFGAFRGGGVALVTPFGGARCTGSGTGREYMAGNSVGMIPLHNATLSSLAYMHEGSGPFSSTELAMLQPQKSIEAGAVSAP